MWARPLLATALLAVTCACSCEPARPPSSAALSEVRSRALHGKQARALETLERWARGGDPGSQRALADVYAAGGDRSGHERALHLYGTAAAAGDMAAQMTLGRALRRGELGVAVDMASARKWYSAAAAQGEAGAELALGLMARNGEGGPRDPGAAVSWLERAAEHGSAEAMFHLGNIFAEGEGVPRDLARAREWYERAADRGLPVALQTLGMAYRTGDLGLPRDEEKADELLREAGHQAPP